MSPAHGEDGARCLGHGSRSIRALPAAVASHEAGGKGLEGAVGSATSPRPGLGAGGLHVGREGRGLHGAEPLPEPCGSGDPVGRRNEARRVGEGERPPRPGTHRDRSGRRWWC